MPPKFKFTKPDQTVWEAPLVKERCISHGSNGGRCKRQVFIGQPYCWQHLLIEKKLKVEPSGIPGAGNGVFVRLPKPKQNDRPVRAVQVIYDGTPANPGPPIVDYTGQRIDSATLQARYGDYTAPYGLEVKRTNPKIFVDSATRRGIGSLINHPPNGRAPNVILYDGTHHNGYTSTIRAIRPIRVGDELLADYGQDYRMPHIEGTHYSTK